MLHLFAKGQPKVRIFFLKILSYVFVLHLTFLFYLLFFSEKKILKICTKNNLNSIPVVLLPFTKTVTGSLNSIVNGKEKFTSIKSKKSPKVIIQKNLKIQKQKAECKAKAKVKDVKKPITDKVKFKKEKKESQKQQMLMQQSDFQDLKTDNNQRANDENAMLSAQQNQIEVGRQDLQEMQLHELIKNQITKFWKAPSGLSKKLKCKIKAFIDNQGQIIDVKIVESSKSLAFDSSATRDIIKTIMPKEIYGNYIEIQYGPEEEENAL